MEFHTHLPVGLGAVAVDSLATSVIAGYKYITSGRKDIGVVIPHLDKLVNRMKKSPAGVFTRIGENAGDAAYELSKISPREWAHLWSLNWQRLKRAFSF